MIRREPRSARYDATMRRALALLAGGALILACTATLPRPPYVRHPTSDLGPVAFPPPPARVEAIPPRPDGDTVWIDGEWTWDTKRWSWLPGRWVIVPAGLSYSPWTRVRAADGTLYFANGLWRDAAGNETPGPKGIKYATVSTGPVVNAQ